MRTDWPRWARVSEPSMAYAIGQGQFGDEFCKNAGGDCLQAYVVLPQEPEFVSISDWHRYFPRFRPGQINPSQPDA